MKKENKNLFYLCVVTFLLHLPLLLVLDAIKLFNVEQDRRELRFSISMQQKNVKPAKPETQERKEELRPAETPKETKKSDTPPKPEPKKEKKEKPPIEELINPDSLPTEYRLGDEFASNNQTNPEIKEIQTGTEKKPKKGKQVKPVESGAEKKVQSGSVTTISDSKTINASTKGKDEDNRRFKAPKGVSPRINESKQDNLVDLESESDLLLSDIAGTMEMMTDDDLDGAFVMEPFSLNQSNEMKSVNLYLQTITQQMEIEKQRITAINPIQGKEKRRTSVIAEIAVNGKLVRSHTVESSGDKHFDDVLLTAVRSVDRFVTYAELGMAQGLRFIRFTWSYPKQEYEIMPFELDNYGGFPDDSNNPNQDSEVDNYSINTQ